MFEYFYHEILRRSVIAFGSLFNDISIKHTNNSNEHTDKDLIIMLIKQNTELIKETSNCKNMMMNQSNVIMKILYFLININSFGFVLYH